jgi:hypothetical protein
MRPFCFGHVYSTHSALLEVDVLRSAEDSGMTESWFAKNNPLVVEDIYDDEDNKFLDILCHIYAAISERLSTKGGFSKELSDACWLSGPGFTTAISSYQACVILPEIHSAAKMTLLRDSLHGLCRAGIDWSTIPTDSYSPQMQQILKKMINSYREWQKDKKGLMELPPDEIYDNIMESAVFFDQVNIPEIFQRTSVDSYNILSSKEPFPISEFTTAVRIPLGVGAILNWKRSWISDWSANSDLSGDEGHWQVARDVRDELLQMVNQIMENQNIEPPDWFKTLLPFND